MFGDKGKINTSRFFPMLHHEASPEKPKYDMATPPPISRQPLLLFLLKVFIPTPPSPPTFMKGRGEGYLTKQQKNKTARTL